MQSLILAHHHNDPFLHNGTFLAGIALVVLSLWLLSIAVASYLRHHNRFVVGVCTLVSPLTVGLLWLVALV
ncbi:MAG: hypothetical protein F4138_04035 [Acidimicrobiia bacterium]|nr:hypothetical protein [Acidimicrobiia bacterium]